MTMTSPIPSLEQESDPDLLCLIGMADDDTMEAHDCFREFHRRHAVPLYSRLEQWIYKKGDVRRRALDAEALASETLVRAFHHAGSYHDMSGGDRERGTLQVRAWLFRIANRLAADELKKPAIRLLLNQADGLPDADILEEKTAVSPLSAARVDQVTAAFETLSIIDQDIISTCLAFGAYGDNADALPPEIRKALMTEHGLTDVTFRQRKSRAFKKLRELLS